MSKKEEYDFSHARQGAVVKTPPHKQRITIRRFSFSTDGCNINSTRPKPVD